MLLAFIGHAVRRYVKNGKPTSEVRSFRAALRPVRRLYGRQSVTAFGPLALAACKQELIDTAIVRKRINQHLTRIRQVFKWGVANEMVDESVWRALCAVEGVRRGQAVESEPVRPVPMDHIEAIEPYLMPQVWGLVNLQLWSGCRPMEACIIRGLDIDMTGDVWEYHPEAYKTEHHDKERLIYLGPKAQDAIRAWLKLDQAAYLFSPQEAVEWCRQQRAAKRKTPKSTRSKRCKRGVKPKRGPGMHYTTCSYYHAIKRACERAGIPQWAPHRLRHNAGTRIRAEFGIEEARVTLGVASLSTTEIYAEFDREKARKIMRKLG